MVSGILEVVGHIAREVSRHTYFYIKEEGGLIDGSVLSTRYHPSPISGARLEIPFMITFRSSRYITDQKMKGFMTKLYCFDHKPVTKNVEIKENVVEEGEYSEVVVAPKAKKGKVTIAYNSDDSDEEKVKMQKKTAFENNSDDAISESVSKLNKIVSYDYTSSDS